jgi:hypothetical protein
MTRSTGIIEAKTAFAEDADTGEAKALTQVCIQGYQAMVPALAGMKGEVRKTRGKRRLMIHCYWLEELQRRFRGR